MAMSIRSLPVVFAAGLALAGAGQALAQPYGDRPEGYAPSVGEVIVQSRPNSDVTVRSEAVSFADLDLNSDAGADALLRRINAASKRVCQPEPTTPGALSDSTDYAGCRNEAIARAVDEVDSPTLSAAYDYRR
jgi:UrcA family protein